MAYWDERCKKVLTDTHYWGAFLVMLRDEKGGKIAFEVSAKLSDKPGFEVLPIRWVVEKTISWTNFYRRLIKDFERTVENSVAWVIWTNISLMLNRMTYLLGEILEFNSIEGAFIQEISPETFRKRLSRQDKKINEFTKVDCGLINANNPCRCHKKIEDAIEKRRVDLKNLLFASRSLISTIAEVENAVQLIQSNPIYDLPENVLSEIREIVGRRFV